MRTPNANSYLWKTTHLNRAQRGRSEIGWEEIRREKRKGGETVECEKQGKGLLPPKSSTPTVTATHSTTNLTQCSCKTPTFAFSRAKAAALTGWSWALVDRYGLCVLFRAGDFTVNLIGQIPQKADAVLHQL